MKNLKNLVSLAQEISSLEDNLEIECQECYNGDCANCMSLIMLLDMEAEVGDNES